MNIIYSRSKLYKHPRAHLKPLIEFSPIRTESPGSNFIQSNRDLIFLSPQPQQLQNSKTSSVFLSHKSSETFSIKDKLMPIALKYSNSETKPLTKIKETLEKSQNTPPHIKKLEKFWEKIGKISEKNLEAEGKDANFNKSKKNKIFNNFKNKFSGFPARFKEVSLDPPKKTGQEKLSLSKGLKQDLFILKSNSKNELKYRIQAAKAARISEESNREGILKKTRENNSWIWKTPEGTPVDKSVKFDLD